MTNGRVNPQFTLEDQGITGLGTVYYNLLEPTLIEKALERKEGTLGKGGAFLVSTGKFTGRSPKDKHVVKTASVADSIWWENNAAMSEAGFEALYEDMIAHMQGRDYFVQDLFGGADPANRLDVRMVTELTVEIEHSDTPALVADWINVAVFSQPQPSSEARRR